MSADLFYRVQVSAGPVQHDLSRELSSLEVSEGEGVPSRLVLQLTDPYKVLGHAIQEGMEMEAELGTVEDHSLVFRGRVHQVDASFPEREVSTVTVRAHDNGMRMGLRRRNRRWADTTLSGALAAIAREHGFHQQTVRLQGDPEFSGNGIRQQDETDLAFVHRLAERFGAVMYILAGDFGDEFVVLSEREIMTASPEVTLHHGRVGVAHPLLAFEARADVAEIQLPRILSGIDYESGDPTEVVEWTVDEVGDLDDLFFDENMNSFRQDEPLRALSLQGLLSAAPLVRQEVLADLGEVERVTTPTFASPGELRTRAENQFSTSLHGMSGSGSTHGIHAMRAQTNVRIEDVGGRFSGTWFLSEVRHLLDDEGYRTEFECRR